MLITVLSLILFINSIIHKNKQNIYSTTFVVARNCAFWSMVQTSLRNILCTSSGDLTLPLKMGSISCPETISKYFMIEIWHT